MAAPPIPAVPTPIPADVQGYLTVLDVALGVTAVMFVGLVWALWLVCSRLRRRQTDAAQLHAWQTAYWHLLATAQCPPCGSRMEPEPAPAPTGPRRIAPQPHRGDL